MSPLKKLPKNTQLKIAFMPIKPIYADRIVNGEKKFEYRRTMINDNLSHIIIYSSSPIKNIIAIAKVVKVHWGSPYGIWESTKYAAGITRKQYREYFKGAKNACAIELGFIYKLKIEMKPSDIDENLKVPQSYSYVNEDTFKKVFKKLGDNKVGVRMFKG
jgi:predicted transcriptional regulator